MDTLNQVLVIGHFLGLAMAFSAGFANLTMAGLIRKAAEADRPVLARFPPVMARFADVGLTLLVISGLALVFTKWGGFGVFPGTFHMKLTLVAVLLGLLGYIHVLARKARNGDQAAAARIPVVGRINVTIAIVVVVLAVLTFN